MTATRCGHHDTINSVKKSFMGQDLILVGIGGLVSEPVKNPPINLSSRLKYLCSILFFVLCLNCQVTGRVMAAAEELTLAKVRDALIRQEDTIIFCLIERARLPLNLPTYSYQSSALSGSLVEFVVRETEALQAKAGRYENPEENPFFPNNLPPSEVPANGDHQVLHPAATSININNTIWDMYFRQLLPLFVTPGDDGNYAQTAASDLNLLQAISRRIHYGKFVAEVKFRDVPNDYEPAIRARDRDALMKLLTFERVEEAVKKRVEKKARVFGQEVTLDDADHEEKQKYKVDPSVVSRLYSDWIMPLTKQVQVEYLLRRLD